MDLLIALATIPFHAVQKKRIMSPATPLLPLRCGIFLFRRKVFFLARRWVYICLSPQRYFISFPESSIIFFCIMVCCEEMVVRFDVM